MEHRVEKIESYMVDVKIRLAVAESNIKDVKEDISSIKDDARWFVKVPVLETFTLIQTVWKKTQVYFRNPDATTFQFHLYAIVVYCLNSTTHRYLV